MEWNDWFINLIKSKELWSSFFGAGFGAWFGAKLSIWQRSKDEHDLNFLNFKTLMFRILNLRDNILNFKRDIVNDKLSGLKEKNLNKITYIIAVDDFSFEEELSRYNFIGNKNPSIYSLIIEINRSIKVFRCILQKHNELLESFYDCMPEDCIDNPQSYRLSAVQLYRLSNCIEMLNLNTKILSYLSDLLLRALLTYKDKYYKYEKVNIIYEEMENDVKDLIPNSQDKDVPKNWEESIDNWLEEKSFLEKYFPTSRKVFLFFKLIKKSYTELLSYEIAK